MDPAHGGRARADLCSFKCSQSYLGYLCLCPQAFINVHMIHWLGCYLSMHKDIEHRLTMYTLHISYASTDYRLGSYGDVLQGLPSSCSATCFHCCPFYYLLKGSLKTIRLSHMEEQVEEAGISTVAGVNTCGTHSEDPSL